jgi:hypothetical protein
MAKRKNAGSSWAVDMNAWVKTFPWSRSCWVEVVASALRRRSHGKKVLLNVEKQTRAILSVNRYHDKIAM